MEEVTDTVTEEEVVVDTDTRTVEDPLVMDTHTAVERTIISTCHRKDYPFQVLLMQQLHHQNLDIITFTKREERRNNQPLLHK